MIKKISCIFIIMAIYPSSAFAYLDPGTGSIILQLLIGAIAAIVVTAKLYWQKLLNFFGIKKKLENNKDNKTN